MIFLLEYFWMVIVFFVLAYPFVWIYFTAKEMTYSYKLTRWFMAYPIKILWAVARAMVLLLFTCIPYAIVLVVIALATGNPIKSFDWLGYTYVYFLFILSLWKAIKDIREDELFIIKSERK